MKVKIKESQLKQLIGESIKNVLNENVDISFIDVYKKRFKLIQQKYNNFFNGCDYSYALFYNIMVEFDETKRDFEITKNNVLSKIYKQDEDSYYRDIENNNSTENSINEIDRDVNQLNDLFEQASNALKSLDETPYTINIF